VGEKRLTSPRPVGLGLDLSGQMGQNDRDSSRGFFHPDEMRPQAVRTNGSGDVETTDEKLVARLLAGDDAAAGELVRRYSTPLYNFAYRFTGNREEAQEIAQDALLKALKNMDRFDPRYRFSTWVYRICRNHAIDRKRRKRPTSELNEGITADPGHSDPDGTGTRSPEVDAMRAEENVMLHRALATLGEKYREIIVLYHFNGLSYRDIAETLDIPQGTVMNRLFRARNKLREAMVRLQEATV
jgi:RNA polymerase sigma-70 factor, ECF subfamily